MLIGRYSAVLDANVLHPAFLRAALFWFADERLFQPVWSQDILQEWRRSIKKRFSLDDAAVEKAAAAFLRFPDAEIDGYQDLIPSLKLPDEDDRHVLAAAILGKCNGIVTANGKHFPPAIAAQYTVEIIHPDDFIVNIIDLHQERAIAACKRHRAAMTQTNPSVADYLARFERSGLIQAHGRLSKLSEVL